MSPNPTARAPRDAFLNGKGGSGKTFGVVQTAHALARRKKRVLVVEVDPQDDAADRLAAGDPSRQTMAEVLDPNNPCPITDAITPCGWDVPEAAYIHVAQGGYALEERLHETDKPGSQFRLRRALDQIPEDMYDHVLLNADPSLGHLVQNCIAALDGDDDRVWITLIPERNEIKGGLRMATFVSHYRHHLMVPNLRFGGVIINKADTRLKLHNRYIAEMAQTFKTVDQGSPVPVLPDVIPFRARLAETQSESLPITSFRPSECEGVVEAIDGLTDVIEARGMKAEEVAVSGT